MLKKYGFACVDHEAVHLFILRGRKYKSACGIAFRPPNLGMNSMLTDTVHVHLEEGPWNCPTCEHAWREKVNDAIDTLNRAGEAEFIFKLQ